MFLSVNNFKEDYILIVNQWTFLVQHDHVVPVQSGDCWRSVWCHLQSIRQGEDSWRIQWWRGSSAGLSWIYPGNWRGYRGKCEKSCCLLWHIHTQTYTQQIQVRLASLFKWANFYFRINKNSALKLYLISTLSLICSLWGPVLPLGQNIGRYIHLNIFLNN